MTRAELKAKVKDLVASLQSFNDWDAETDEPALLEVELDDVWKVVQVREEGFQTVKVHRRLEGQQ
jgi:hypothetical protein